MQINTGLHSSQSYLKAAMYRKLEQKFERASSSSPVILKRHWRAQGELICEAYQQGVKKLDDHLANVHSALQKIRVELAKLDTIYQLVDTYPSHQAIAQIIPLGIPAT